MTPASQLMPNPPRKYRQPFSWMEPCSMASATMVAPDATTVAPMSRRLADMRAIQTTSSMSGNMPPGFSSTTTMNAAGMYASSAKSHGRSSTPPTTSAHGNKPTRAATTVGGVNVPSWPKMAISAIATAATPSSTVVETALTERSADRVTWITLRSVVTAVTGP
jgi:hypothetical protein